MNLIFPHMKCGCGRMRSIRLDWNFVSAFEKTLSFAGKVFRFLGLWHSKTKGGQGGIFPTLQAVTGRPVTLLAEISGKRGKAEIRHFAKPAKMAFKLDFRQRKNRFAPPSSLKIIGLQSKKKYLDSSILNSTSLGKFVSSRSEAREFIEILVWQFWWFMKEDWFALSDLTQ